jgi:hypothetical protein
VRENTVLKFLHGSEPSHTKFWGSWPSQKKNMIPTSMIKNITVLKFRGQILGFRTFSEPVRRSGRGDVCADKVKHWQMKSCWEAGTFENAAKGGELSGYCKR